MKIKEIVTQTWWQLSNEHADKYSNYKLHVALPIKFLDKYYHKMRSVLRKAVEDGVIQGFKILNIGSSETILNSLGNKDATIKENPNVRLYNNPITIYLYEDFNPSHVATLCQQIEQELKETPGCNPDYLSEADVPIMTHISMRQEKLYDAYIAIADASQRQLEVLKNKLKASTAFKSLTNEITKGENSNKTSDNYGKDAEKAISGFHISSYEHFNKTLHAKDINMQFRAACDILQIDHKHFSNEIQKINHSSDSDPIKQDLIKLVSKQFRIKSSKFHTDKLTTIKNLQPGITEKAREIFNLMNDANTILKTIIDKPELISKNKDTDINAGLAQDKYVPHYEYELASGYVNDAWFYVHLAGSDKFVQLRKNWEIEETPVLELNNNSANNSLQIYQKTKRYYNKSGKIETLPGYVAFFKLWQANALAHRFNHFDYIFSRENKMNAAEKWLAEKMLTVADFAACFSTYELNSIAINASGEGIINLGNTSEDVFWYLYNTMPEIIHKDRVEQYFLPGSDSGLKPLIMDQNSIFQKILASPSNLRSIPEEALVYLCELNKDLKEYVYSRKEFHKHLQAKMTEYRFIQPLFEESTGELDDLDQFILRKLILGNPIVLTAINIPTLEKYKEYIIQHSQLSQLQTSKYILPSFLVDYITEEINNRQTANDYVENNADQYQNAFKFIKERVLAGKFEMVEKLSEHTLICLATEPEVAWESYLPIARALINLGQTEKAKPYLMHVAHELALNASNMSANDLLTILTAEEKRILELREVSKQSQIKSLCDELNKQIEDKGYSVTDVSTVITQLEALGKKEYIRDLYYKNIQPALQKTFYDLVKRLYAGEKTDQLKDEFKALKIEYERLDKLFGYSRPWNWSQFIKNDENNHAIYGDDLFCLFEDSLGLISNNAQLWRNKADATQIKFGINPNDNDLFKILRDIYYIYECLGMAEVFYKDLICHTKHKHALEEVEKELGVSIPSQFDEATIKNYLSSFAINELTVFAEGKRTNVFYKKHEFIDHQDIKQFVAISTLYNRLGLEHILIDMLPAVFDKILISDQEFLRHPHISLEHHKFRPLHRYVQIANNKSYQEKLSSNALVKINKTEINNQKSNTTSIIFSEQSSENQLASLALEYALYHCINNIIIEYDMFNSKYEKRIIHLKNEMSKLYKESLQKNSLNLHQMLVLLAKFLDDYPLISFNDIPNRIYLKLLINLQNDSITCNFFNLKTVKIQDNVRSISHALAESINAKSYKLNTKENYKDHKQPKNKQLTYKQNDTSNNALATTLAIEYPASNLSVNTQSNISIPKEQVNDQQSIESQAISTDNSTTINKLLINEKLSNIEVNEPNTAYIVNDEFPNIIKVYIEKIRNNNKEQRNTSDNLFWKGVIKNPVLAEQRNILANDLIDKLIVIIGDIPNQKSRARAASIYIAEQQAIHLIRQAFEINHKLTDHFGRKRFGKKIDGNGSLANLLQDCINAIEGYKPQRQVSP